MVADYVIICDFHIAITDSRVFYSMDASSLCSDLLKGMPLVVLLGVWCILTVVLSFL